LWLVVGTISWWLTTSDENTYFAVSPDPRHFGGDFGMGWSERWSIQRYGVSLGEMTVNYVLDVDKFGSFSPENLVKIWTFVKYNHTLAHG
jgi:hypothetical protein